MADVIVPPKVCFTFIWRIENFSLAIKLPNNNHVNSLEFIPENLTETRWCLILFSVGYDGEKDAFSLRLHKITDCVRNVIGMSFELSIISNCASNVKSVSEQRFHFHMGNAYGTPLRITLDEIFSKREILPRDTLTVQCKMWYGDGNRLGPGFSLTRTRIGAKRKSFIWIIDKFSTLQVNDTKSVKVELRPNLRFALTLTVFLTGTNTYDGKIRMKAEGNNEETLPLILLFGISVQNVNGKAKYRFEDEFKFSNGKEELPLNLTLDRKELTSNKDLLLPDDKLSLKCDLVAFKFCTTESIVLNEIEYTTYGADAETDLENSLNNTFEAPFLRSETHSSSNSLTNDLRHLFENKYLADINLKVRDEIFPAHKAVLGARSSVFKTMFETDMKEKFTNTIEIDDIEPDTMRRFLLYIYSDTLDSDFSWENASSLCLTAEKYSVNGLKEQCTSFLKQNLSLTNVCETLFLADILIDEDLKNATLDYIEKNDKDIMNSNEWKLFKQEHLQLAVEILSLLYRRVKEF